MIFRFDDPSFNSILKLVVHEPHFSHSVYKENEELILSIVWNAGKDQKVIIDEAEYDFPEQSILPLLANHSFRFEDSSSLITWQFNRDFYCIIDHDQEVSCAGFIFYGSKELLFIQLSDEDEQKIKTLYQVFRDEFAEKDGIQGEMLRMLLKRLIIMITRLGKKQYWNKDVSKEETDLVREFNVLVENNFKELHQVQDYANLLNKSPKTLANSFAKYSEKSPLAIIQERIVLEAKRLLFYTDKTASEIAYEVGFDEPSSFSRFFKKHTSISPSKFKAEMKLKGN